MHHRSVLGERARSREMLGDVGTILRETISLKYGNSDGNLGLAATPGGGSIVKLRTCNILLNSTRAHNFNNIINDTTIFFSSHGVFTTDVVISGRYSHFLQHIIKVV